MSRAPLQFRSLRSRIVVFFALLLLTVEVAGFAFINATILQNARNTIREELVSGERVFNRLLERNAQQMVEAAIILSSDFGFRGAIASNDRETVISALRNLGTRIKASGMMLVTLDNNLFADTLWPNYSGKPFAFPELIKMAEQERGASAVVVIDGISYQFVVVPVLAPLPIAWVVLAFGIDDKLAQDLQRLTSLHVTFLSRQVSEDWKIFATTLPTRLNDPLMQQLAKHRLDKTGVNTVNILDEEYETLVSVLDTQGNAAVAAVLQRSLQEALEPFKRLQIILLILAAISLLATVTGSMMIARTITRPVSALVKFTRQVEKGDYSQIADIPQKDEIGGLAMSFNYMVKGLAERDKVRSLLGKTVSSAVAEELLSKGIELGGEERVVTILFSDVRNFTALCENRPPKEILMLLNIYLTKISAVIDAHGGVVDKYIGDAVMALFGAPLARPDDPIRAVETAFGMQSELAALNLELRDMNMPQLEIGIGINTDLVVAGNMGSQTRLNYTVLGDGVNLASRLEGLTKRYAVPIIVSETTMTAVREYVYRELDKVRVKGKSVPVKIYEPVGKIGSVSDADLAELETYHAALARYREQGWETARMQFLELQAASPSRRLYQIYLQQIENFSRNPPVKDWDGSYVLYDK